MAEAWRGDGEEQALSVASVALQQHPCARGTSMSGHCNCCLCLDQATDGVFKGPGQVQCVRLWPLAPDMSQSRSACRIQGLVCLKMVLAGSSTKSGAEVCCKAQT